MIIRTLRIKAVSEAPAHLPPHIPPRIYVPMQCELPLRSPSFSEHVRGDRRHQGLIWSVCSGHWSLEDPNDVNGLIRKCANKTLGQMLRVCRLVIIAAETEGPVDVAEGVEVEADAAAVRDTVATAISTSTSTIRRPQLGARFINETTIRFHNARRETHKELMTSRTDVHLCLGHASPQCARRACRAVLSSRHIPWLLVRGRQRTDSVSEYLCGKY